MRNKLIEDFLEEQGYSEEEYNKISSVCKYPYKYIKNMMSKESLPDIRIQYFGIFKPLKKRLKGILNSLDEKLSKNSIKEKDYNRLKIILKKRLDEYN